MTLFICIIFEFIYLNNKHNKFCIIHLCIYLQCIYFYMPYTKMEGNNKYKIIQAVDPTKIKVPIIDRFSKLTLSSNKKKRTNLNEFGQEINTGKSQTRVNRNLMEELSAITLQTENLLLHNTKSDQEQEETRLSAMRAFYASDYSNSNLTHSDKLKITNTKATKSMDFSPTERLESEIICLSSSESTQSNDANSVISLIGSSEDICANEPNEMLLSNVNINSKNCDSDSTPKEREKRVEAFLHDVSLEYNNRLIEDNLNAMTADYQVAESFHNYSDVLKRIQVANADTESMTTGNDLPEKASALLECKKHVQCIHKTPLSQLQSLSTPRIPFENNKNDSSLTRDNDDAGYHANDEILNLTHIDESINNSVQNTLESIVILETDDDDNDDNSNMDNKVRSESRLQEKTGNKKPSNKSYNYNDDFENNNMTSESSSKSDLDNLEIKLANINLSAKIQINIQICSGSTATEENEIQGDDEEKNDNSDDSNRMTNGKFCTPVKKNQNKIPLQSQNNSGKAQTEQAIRTIINENMLERNEYNNTLVEKRNTNMSATTIDNTESMRSTEAVTNTSVTISQAEKMLSALYGNTWQTPEVMRTLNTLTPQSSNIKIFEKTKRNNYDGYITELNGTKDIEKSEDKSVLDDFLIFRENIPNHLESTRCSTRMKKKGNIGKEKVQSIDSAFKIPLRSKNINVQTNRKQRKLLFDDSDGDQNELDNSENHVSDNTDIECTSDNVFISKNLSSTKMTESSEENDNWIEEKDAGKNKKPLSVQSPSNENVQDSDKLIYLDLSKKEIEIQQVMPSSPPANRDAKFMTELHNILRTCRRDDPIKLPSVRSETKSRRKLFNPIYGEEDLKEEQAQTPKNKNSIVTYSDYLDDDGFLPFDCRGILVNKQLESLKGSKPIFTVTPPPKQRDRLKGATPRFTPCTSKEKLRGDFAIPFKYNFLKSLDVCVSKNLCHPDALLYRENYRTKKEELCKILYDLYNEKIFDNKLHVPLTWNKKLCNTAGRCLNKRRMGARHSVIELSDKVLTSADRLRCTLIHEMCHAAAWIFNGESGHGATWRSWAQRSNTAFPEIPKIGVCHQYDIEYKYTYKCSLCGAKSHAHSKSKKVDNIRCAYCHGAIEIFLNKKDKEGNIMQTPVKEATGFAKFVKDNYKKYKHDKLKHTDVMKTLSAEFAAMKMTKA